MSSDYINIIDDGKVKKKILKEGIGEKINENHEMVISYIGKVGEKNISRNKKRTIPFYNR